MITSKDIASYGLNNIKQVVYNPSFELLFEEETKEGLEGYESGIVTSSGAVSVDTGIFHGRSPKDKYVFLDEKSKSTVWWKSDLAKSSDNKPISNEIWNHGKDLAVKQLSGDRKSVV
jgi:phosphoenolpyruvate carboxykinase (ATP)